MIMGIDQKKFLKKSIIKEMMEASWRKETFVTRGAYMYCSMGTHEEILNQPQINGVYINNNPMMTVKDCKVSTSEPDTYAGFPYDKPGPTIDGNMYSFGYCRSLLNPLKIADMAGNINSVYLYDYDPDTNTYFTSDKDRIYPCVPNFSPLTLFTPVGLNFGDMKWQNGNENVLIDGVPALTNRSCLYCKYGGKIELLSNGMEPVPGELLEKG